VTSEAVVRAIAAPVLLRLAGRRRATLQVGGRAAYLDLDGFVAVLADTRTPWLPNAIVLAARAPRTGGEVEIAPGRLAMPGWSARWDPQRPPVWWPLVPAPAGEADALAARGAAILRGLGVAPDRATVARALGGGATAPPAGGVHALWDALANRDVALARRAGTELLGRGGGLTPVGDDLVAGAAATVAAAGDVGFGSAERTAWLAALVPAGLRARTTALSATLLELAIAGAGARPLHALLRLDRDDWLEQLARLEKLGASTGRAMALGVGMAALLLGREPARRAPRAPAPNLQA
jgi:uncharacterized protein DUF2877